MERLSVCISVVADGSIFISYRREDSAGQAGRLYDRLCGHFGKERVSFDVDTIAPGEDFVQVLDTRVRSCAALVTVIGPRWLASSDDNSRRRIDDENDYVRHELAVALKEKIRIIPVLVGRAQMPRSTDLPADISDLARRNAVEITDAAFQAGATRIVEALDAILSPHSAAPGPMPLPPADRVLETSLSPTSQVPSAVRQHQASRARFTISAIGTRSRWDWRVAVVVAFCSGVLALGVAGVIALWTNVPRQLPALRPNLRR